MHTAGFEAAIPANKRLQTHVIERAVTGLGHYLGYLYVNLVFTYLLHGAESFLRS